MRTDKTRRNKQTTIIRATIKITITIRTTITITITITTSPTTMKIKQ
jgi:hypothetical protein